MKFFSRLLIVGFVLIFAYNIANELLASHIRKSINENERMFVADVEVSLLNEQIELKGFFFDLPLSSEHVILGHVDIAISPTEIFREQILISDLSVKNASWGNTQLSDYRTGPFSFRRKHFGMALIQELSPWILKNIGANIF